MVAGRASLLTGERTSQRLIVNRSRSTYAVTVAALRPIRSLSVYSRQINPVGFYLQCVVGNFDRKMFAIDQLDHGVDKNELLI